MDETCVCECCQNYSRAYLRHLFSVGEILGLRLLSLHNVHFFIRLMRNAREAVLKDQYINFKRKILEVYL